MAHFLGLDSSTQSLSALLIDTDAGKVVADRSVNFGERLPQYKSPKGFLPNANESVKHSDPLMWVEALDLVLADLRQAGVDVGKVRGISGAGQQHGSVYLAKSMDQVGDWSPSVPLAEQVRLLLSRPTSPIWTDSSTSAECAEIAAAVGGDERVATISGSRATLRFTGPQIRRFYKTSPAEWQRTVEIHLVSAFVPSLLTGKSANIDLGDGAGMNLLDLATSQWSDALLDATAPGLRAKLPPPVASATVIGEVAGYFVKKYGFAAGTQVIAFTGDNPSSLIGMGASQPGTAVISLGTSDTVFTAMATKRTDPRGYGSVFGNPAGGFMSLACFSNGSLAREEVAKRFGLSWDDFAAAIVDKTQPGNGGNLLLPYFVPEPTPRVLKAGPRWFGSEAFVAGQDGAAAARAVVEAQAISMRIQSDWIGEKMHTILVTAGASQNRVPARPGRRFPGHHYALECLELVRAGRRPACRAGGRGPRLTQPLQQVLPAGAPSDATRAGVYVGQGRCASRNRSNQVCEVTRSKLVLHSHSKNAIPWGVEDYPRVYEPSQGQERKAKDPMSQPIFAGIDAIPFQGPESDTPLSFRFYDKNRVVRGKRMEEHLRIAVCYWHTFCGTVSDPFGSATLDRPWLAASDPMAMAKMKTEAAFEFFTKLGVPYYCFHDRDIAPEGKTLAESNDLLDRIAEVLAGLQQKTGVKLLWGTANLFGNPRFMGGASTNPDPEVFAYAARQVKKALDVTQKLGGENYVLWGDRKGYEILLNTDRKKREPGTCRSKRGKKPSKKDPTPLTIIIFPQPPALSPTPTPTPAPQGSTSQPPVSSPVLPPSLGEVLTFLPRWVAATVLLLSTVAILAGTVWRICH